MKKQKLLKLVECAMLISIMLVLWLTGAGMIMIPPISITTFVIPVVVGAIVLGPSYGAVLGCAFGIFSMIMATLSPNAADWIFSPINSGNPLSSLLMALGVRIFFGWITGFLHKILKKIMHSNISVVISTMIGIACHTFLVMLCLWLLFDNTGITFKAVLSAVLSVNFLAEAGMALAFSLAFANILPIIEKKALN